MEKKRSIIFAKDIGRFTGKSNRYGHRILSRIRQLTGKQKHQVVTTKEYCDYAGIREEDFAKYLE
jgi:hypothetical protein